MRTMVAGSFGLTLGAECLVLQLLVLRWQAGARHFTDLQLLLGPERSPRNVKLLLFRNGAETIENCDVQEASARPHTWLLENQNSKQDRM